MGEKVLEVGPCGAHSNSHQKIKVAQDGLKCEDFQIIEF